MMTKQKNESEEKEARKLYDNIQSHLYGIVILLGLSSVMLLVHLYLAFFFHN